MAKVMPHLIRNFFNCTFSAPESWICIDQTEKWTEQFSLTLDMLSWTMNRYVPKWLPTPLAPIKPCHWLKNCWLVMRVLAAFTFLHRGVTKKKTLRCTEARGKTSTDGFRWWSVWSKLLNCFWSIGPNSSI